MGQPALRTARLRLVPLADEHLELEVELDADPEVLRYITGRARTRDEVSAEHTARMEAATPVDGLGFWMAFRDDDPVGVLMLPPVPDRPGAAELGYRMFRRHWRKGYAAEASLELLRHAFETVGLDRVLAQTMAVNAPSRGVMTKIGMRYVRTFFLAFEDPLPGTEAGEVEYEITRAAWTDAGTVR